MTDPVTTNLVANQTKELLTDVTIPDGSGRSFVHIVAMLPDGRSHSGVNLGKTATEKQSYSGGDLNRLAHVNRKVMAAIDAGGDRRIAALFNNPTQTIAKLEKQNDVIASLQNTITLTGTNIDRDDFFVALSDEGARTKVVDLETPEEKKDRLQEQEVALTEEATDIEVALYPDIEEKIFNAVSYSSAVASIADFSSAIANAATSIAAPFIAEIVSAASHKVGGIARLDADYLDIAYLVGKVTYAIAESAHLANEHGDVVRDVSTAAVNKLAGYVWGEAKELGNAAKEEVFAEMQRVLNEITETAIEHQEQHQQIAEVVTGYIQQEFTPLIRARDAETARERHEILLEGGLLDGGYMEYEPAVPGNEGKLVITVNGHLQKLQDSADTAGMNAATRKLATEGYEVLHFRVGLALGELHQVSNPELLYELTEQVTMDRLNREGIFEFQPNVITIGLMGYSWGGGTVSRLAQTLDFSQFEGIPVHMALIDAVELGSAELASPVIVRPPVDSLFNRYQTHNDPGITDDAANAYRFFAGESLAEKSAAQQELWSAIAKVFSTGNPARGWGFSGLKEGDDQESLGLNTDHFFIDDKVTEDKKHIGKSVIEASTDHIMSKLNQ